MSQLMTIDVENMSPEQMNFLMNKINQKQMSLMQKAIEEIKGELEGNTKRLELVEAKADKIVEVAANSLRVKQGRFEYVNQGDFGRYFSVSIGAVMVGRLLRAVGLAQKMRGPTIPYRQFIPKYAQTNATANYSTTNWHFTNCMEYIDNWLKDKGLYEQFYAIDNERDMERFINGLYQQYVA